jgi:hypothetical protein
LKFIKSLNLKPEGENMKPFNEHNPKLKVKMKTGEYGLHGDVIVTFQDAPEGFDSWPKVKDACLAYGEATGHAHKIFGDKSAFDLRENPKTKERHLRVVSPVMLKHQEHCPVEIPPGEYRIGIQKEYSPFERLIRSVQD